MCVVRTPSADGGEAAALTCAEQNRKDNMAGQDRPRLLRGNRRLQAKRRTCLPSQILFVEPFSKNCFEILAPGNSEKPSPSHDRLFYRKALQEGQLAWTTSAFRRGAPMQSAPSAREGWSA